MKCDKPFIIPQEDFENYAENENGDVSFNYSKTNIWSNSFLSPEIPTENVTQDILSQLGEIKELITDIKNILKDMFEN